MSPTSVTRDHIEIVIVMPNETKHLRHDDHTKTEREFQWLT